MVIYKDYTSDKQSEGIPDTPIRYMIYISIVFILILKVFFTYEYFIKIPVCFIVYKNILAKMRAENKPLVYGGNPDEMIVESSGRMDQNKKSGVYQGDRFLRKYGPLDE